MKFIYLSKQRQERIPRLLQAVDLNPTDQVNIIKRFYDVKSDDVLCSCCIDGLVTIIEVWLLAS